MVPSYDEKANKLTSIKFRAYWFSLVFHRFTTPGSMNSLFTDQNLADFWPGFLALEQTAGGAGWGGGGARKNQNNTVLQYYRDRTIQFYRRGKIMY